MNKFLFLSEMEYAGFNSQRSFAKQANTSYKVLCNHINGVTTNKTISPKIITTPINSANVNPFLFILYSPILN